MNKKQHIQVIENTQKHVTLQITQQNYHKKQTHQITLSKQLLKKIIQE